MQFTAYELEAKRTAIARTDNDSEDRICLYFALGKALEDLREFADSFTQYDKGNALKRAVTAYDQEETASRFGELRSFFTTEHLARTRGLGFPAGDPIFIVGLPRSGSTLIEQILACHTAIEGTAELPEIMNLVEELERKAAQTGERYPAILATLTPSELQALGEQYIEKTRQYRKLGKPFFTDKMPRNFEHIGFIRTVLPNAKIIDARRHPLACGLSNFRQYYGLGQSFSYDLASIGRYYRIYAELMAHFDAAMPGHVHRVHHEQMVKDSEQEIRRLLSYCGVPFEQSCVDFYANDRSVRTISSEQVRMPIFDDGVEQWRNYERWLGPLKQALGPVLDQYPGTHADRNAPTGAEGHPEEKLSTS